MLRITAKVKTDPTGYCERLSQILEDFERYGIQEKPHIIEIALDCYGKDVSQYVRRTIRLTRDAPLDFCHYRDGRYHPGAGNVALWQKNSLRLIGYRQYDVKTGEA